jgi:predicted NBD/HSP70 family sugar kinase
MIPEESLQPIGLADTTAGTLVQLVRQGRAATRADLIRLTGLARSTVTQRVDALIALGLFESRGEAPSTGGRPPTRIGLNKAAGVVLVADLGARHARLAVTDLGGTVLAEVANDHRIDTGPEETFTMVLAEFESLLDQIGLQPSSVRGVGIGVPGPVEFSAGRVVRPPIMPGWDGVAIPELVQSVYSVPILVDNDVNMMAVGEHAMGWPEPADDLLFIKVSTGIGSGVILNGRIHRGAQGTAGDIGHVRVADHGVCHCGNVGCVEALASGDVLAATLREGGIEADGSRDVARLVREGNQEAGRLIRAAGRYLGEALATAVNLLNPSVILIGGEVALAHENFLAGVRDVVYRRSTALATQNLSIIESRLGERAGVIGAAAMVLDQVLSPAAINEWLARA